MDVSIAILPKQKLELREAKSIALAELIKWSRPKLMLSSALAAQLAFLSTVL